MLEVWLRTFLLISSSRWAVVHRVELRRHGSCLEFKLRQLKFVSLVSTGRTREALAYSKILGQFSPKHTKGDLSLFHDKQIPHSITFPPLSLLLSPSLSEIKRLMGCFLFSHRGLEMSPYADLLDPWRWTEVADTFAKDACKLLGLSLESPLGVR